jgi:aminocarboxymuconate-semialdehyde decarboxylase
MTGTPVVDMHSHFLPESWPDLAERFGTPDWPAMRHLGNGKAMVMVGEKEFRPVTSACWDPAVRLADMDRDGIDIELLCATPVLFAYQREARAALACAELFNEAALDLCARGEGRLKALAQVPLQDTDLACRAIERAMADGHLGVQIGTHVGDRDLDDEGILAFLQHCAQIGAPVLVHPWDMFGGVRTSRHMIGWTVSMPAETQLSIVALILGGGFDRLPRDLRICFAHGGGSFAFLLGRLANAWHHRDIARGRSEHPPSHYLDRFSVDGAVFDPRSLRLLVEVMGENRVMLGSDYPFPLGEQRIGSLIRASGDLDAVQKAKLLGGNAVRFFSLAAAG